jgi:plasmid stability protein
MPSPRRRPPEPPERFTEALHVQLTPTARTALEGRAAQSGRTLSDYARDILLSETQAQPAPRPSRLDFQAIRALAAQFGRLGNNINQLARWANEQGTLPAQKTLEEMAMILRLCAEKVLTL